MAVRGELYALSYRSSDAAVIFVAFTTTFIVIIIVAGTARVGDDAALVRRNDSYRRPFCYPIRFRFRRRRRRRCFSSAAEKISENIIFVDR